MMFLESIKTFLVGICSALLFSLASAPAEALELRELAVDEMGYTYVAYPHGLPSFGVDLIKLNPDGSVDSSFADQGVFVLYQRDARFLSVDIWKGSIAVSNDTSLTLMDTSGKLLKEIRWAAGSHTYVKFLDDGSLIGSGGRSHFFKMNSDFASDPSFGAGGEKRLKGKVFDLDRIIPRRDGSYAVVGRDWRRRVNRAAFGCLDAGGEACAGQSDYYMVDRYEPDESYISELVEGPAGQLMALGESKDETQLAVLLLDQEMGVSKRNRIALAQKGYLQTAGYRSPSLTAFALVLHDLVTLASVYKLGADGTADQSYGSGGVAALDFSKMFQSVYLWKMSVGAGGKVTLGGRCGDLKTRREDLCLVRLGADGFLDKTFGVGGIIAYENL